MSSTARSRYYHRTSMDSAKPILVDGFKDTTGRYMTLHEHTGVWIADRILDANEGTGWFFKKRLLREKVCSYGMSLELYFSCLP